MPVFDAVHAANPCKAQALFKKGFTVPPRAYGVWFFKNNAQGRAAALAMAAKPGKPVCLQTKINYRAQDHTHWTSALERKVRDRLAVLERSLGRALSDAEEHALRGKILRLTLMLSGKSGVNVILAGFPLADGAGAKKLEGCFVLKGGPLPSSVQEQEQP